MLVAIEGVLRERAPDVEQNRVTAARAATQQLSVQARATEARGIGDALPNHAAQRVWDARAHILLQLPSLALAEHRPAGGREGFPNFRVGSGACW